MDKNKDSTVPNHGKTGVVVYEKCFFSIDNYYPRVWYIHREAADTSFVRRPEDRRIIIKVSGGWIEYCDTIARCFGRLDRRGGGVALLRRCGFNLRDGC